MYCIFFYLEMITYYLYAYIIYFKFLMIFYIFISIHFSIFKIKTSKKYFFLFYACQFGSRQNGLTTKQFTPKWPHQNGHAKMSGSTLRLLTHAPWYVSNLSLHNDLKISTTTELTTSTIMYKRFHQNLSTHTNTLISPTFTVSLPSNPPRRLKRKCCKDLLNQLQRCCQ